MDKATFDKLSSQAMGMRLDMARAAARAMGCELLIGDESIELHDRDGVQGSVKHAEGGWDGGPLAQACAAEYLLHGLARSQAASKSQ